MNSLTDTVVRNYARQIADSIIESARDSGSDPIAWVTGNSYAPPLRSFSQAEAIWQQEEDPDAWEMLTELIESHLSDANVTLESPEYDNSLYAVDLDRFEYSESATGEYLQDNWIPVK